MWMMGPLMGHGRTPRRSGERRARTQAERIGSEIALARADGGWSRATVAMRAGVSADTERRVEQGDPGVRLETLCAVGAAVNIDIVVQAYPARQPSLRDSGQLGIAEILCALASDRLNPAIEVRVGDDGKAVDVGFFGAEEIIDAEIERLLLDLQRQYRRAALKRDELARRHNRPVRLVLVVEDTPRNRAAVAEHAPFLRRVLPADSREVLLSLRTGAPLGKDGLLWIRRRRPPPASRMRR
jgi:transcriptional regulator with XRE-family HTH domain